MAPRGHAAATLEMAWVCEAADRGRAVPLARRSRRGFLATTPVPTPSSWRASATGSDSSRSWPPMVRRPATSSPPGLGCRSGTFASGWGAWPLPATSTTSRQRAATRSQPTTFLCWPRRRGRSSSGPRSSTSRPTSARPTAGSLTLFATVAACRRASMAPRWRSRSNGSPRPGSSTCSCSSGCR